MSWKTYVAGAGRYFSLLQNSSGRQNLLFSSPLSLRRGSEHREGHKSGHDEATIESQVCMIRKPSSQPVYYAGEESSRLSKCSPLVAQQHNSSVCSAGSTGASGGRRYRYRMTKTEGLVTWNRVESSPHLGQI